MESLPTATAAQAWSARVPRRLLTTVAPLLLTVAVAVSLARQPVVTDPRSTLSAVSSAAQGVAIASIALLVVRPHATIGWAALGAVAVAATPGSDGARSTWLVVALALTMLALADAIGAARQRVVARSWAERQTPTFGPWARALLVGRATGATAVALAAVLVALVAGAWWVHDTRATQAFYATAVTGTGTIDFVADDALSAKVQTEDGTLVRVPTPILSPAVGEEVVLRRSPDGTRAELVDDPFDPTGALLLATGALLTTLVLLRSDVVRRRAVRELMRDGGSAPTFVAVPTGGPWLALEAVGDRGRTVSRVRISDEVVAEEDTGTAGDAIWGSHGKADENDEEVRDDDVDDDLEPGDHAPEWSAYYGSHLETTSDAELLELGAAQRAEAEVTRAGQALAGAPLDAPQLVVVHGLRAQGDHPVILTQDGRWLLTTRAARDTRLRWIAQPQRLLGIHAVEEYRQPADVAAPTPAETTRPGRSGWYAVIGRTGKTVPWLLTPLVALAYRWLVREDVGTVTLLQLGMLAGVGYAWMTYAQDRLSMSAAGVRVRGAAFAVLVRWERLRSAVADDDSLVLRVVDPSDALIVHQHHQLGRFLPGAATPVDAARQIEMSRPGPATLRKGGVTYLPTPAVLVVLTWLASAAVGVALA